MARDQKRGALRSAAFAVLAVVLAVVFVAGLGSVLHVAGLIALPSQAPLAERSHTRYDAELGWVNLPGVSLPDFYGPGASLHTDARGFRGFVEIEREVPPGRVRVVCSGDSFTLGYGVDDDETWCQQLAALDARIEPVNMGQGGYGVDQAYLWWLRDGAPLPHQAHVFAFILEDFARMEVSEFFGYGKPRLALRDGALQVENVPVPRRAYVWPWLTRNLALLGELRPVAWLSALLGPVPRDPARKFLAESPGLAIAVFEDLTRRHADAQRELVLAYLPMQEEYADDGTAELRAFLARETASRGIRYVDLVEDLRRLPAGAIDPLFIAEGAMRFPGAAGHYTAAGNRRVAEWIYARVGGALLRSLRGGLDRFPGEAGGRSPAVSVLGQRSLPVAQPIRSAPATRGDNSWSARR